MVSMSVFHRSDQGSNPDPGQGVARLRVDLSVCVCGSPVLVLDSALAMAISIIKKMSKIQNQILPFISFHYFTNICVES